MNPPKNAAGRADDLRRAVHLGVLDLHEQLLEVEHRLGLDTQAVPVARRRRRRKR